FPFMSTAIRLSIRIGMRSVEGIGQTIVPAKPRVVVAAVVVTPEECGVVTRLLPWIGAPDVGDARVRWTVNGQPVQVGPLESEAHRRGYGRRSREIQPGEDRRGRSRRGSSQRGRTACLPTAVRAG